MSRTLKLSLFCAGIFACGVVTGGLGARKYWHYPQPPGPPPGQQNDGFGPQQLRRLSTELELSEAQRESILPILEKAGEQLRQLRRESFQQSSKIIEAMEASVAELLTAEQKEKLAVFQAEQRARIKARIEERNRRRSEGGETRRDGVAPDRGPDEAMPPPRPDGADVEGPPAPAA